MDRMSECREAQGSARVTVPVKYSRNQVGVYVGRVKEQGDDGQDVRVSRSTGKCKSDRTRQIIGKAAGYVCRTGKA
jgi:hypothetical protein